MAAARLHARLHTDLSRPVDVFRIVQELGIWLNSRPLGNLFGFYLRRDEALGICLNASHPETLQRYTCAHELGHHLLGHGSNLDDAMAIDGRGGGTPGEERAAQVFAGSFLMPLGLVNRVLRRLGLYDKPLAASDVYKVSRDLDVSFTAAVWRLRTLDRLDGSTAMAYANAGAAAAKASLRWGEPPHGSARADLWVVESTDDDLIAKCRIGDEILLRLVENRSTGYVWQIETLVNDSVRYQEASLVWDGGEVLLVQEARNSGQLALPTAREVLRVVEDRHREAESFGTSELGLGPRTNDVVGAADDQDHSWLRQALGVGGFRQIVVIAESTGDGILRLELKPPREQDTTVMATVSLTVRVRPSHELDGFADRQSVTHVARLAA